jgi:hypothetical protein
MWQKSRFRIPQGSGGEIFHAQLWSVARGEFGLSNSVSSIIPKVNSFVSHLVGHNQGDQMSLWKSRPKCSPTHVLSHLLHNYKRGEKLHKFLYYFCNLQKMPKVNSRPMSENLPDLVTMGASTKKTKKLFSLFCARRRN